ncbi:MAG: hypothetical protein V9E89_08830 [Ilumatobacteraceae bacterium]
MLQTRAFVDAWQKKQWGRIVPLMPPQLISMKSPGEAAEYAKSWFDAHEIGAVQIDRVEYTQSSVAEIRDCATIDGVSGDLRLRWVYFDSGGELAINGEAGTWHLAVVAPNTYLVDDDARLT